jgi:indolepyruvate ferredoxin oxidoreductase
MAKHVQSLQDKFDLGEARLLLTGAQAIVRLALMQRQRDAAAGLDTAGYVTGYRGSPIAGLEGAFLRAADICKQHSILFHPGLNEDLAATALWGTQQAELRGEGRHDGVFGIWYGKGPGVDRTGDAFRHANHAGTSRHGGVIALMGDDHTCESSTSAHQSEFAFVDFMIPVLNPAGVQELIDYGLIGFAFSRYAGVWVGIKCVKDTIESTATVDGRLDRVKIVIPGDDEFQMPPGGLNIRLGDTALAKEARLHDYKRRAATAFARANGLDRMIMSGGPEPKIGIITTGKSYLDTRAALDELGIDEASAGALGLRLYKVGMVWPLEGRGLRQFAEGLDLVIVIEEKRSLIETQVKEQLYDLPTRPMVIGKRNERDDKREWLFPAKGALEPLDIAIAIGERLVARERGGPSLAERVEKLKRRRAGLSSGLTELFTRMPYYCAGCPHNSSTVVPEGSRAYAGIGCHYMVQWMDRATEGFTQMGAEGANWIGEAPFSKRAHVFQNLGDGTYIHSGSLAIRAAIAAGVNVTFKLLYNDAVAMTGGQKLDGGITVPQMAAQVLAEGVAKCVIVTDEPEKYAAGSVPREVPVHHRRDLDTVQKELAAKSGVTVLIYDQTCAAEKRRRRKRGTFPDPDKRVFINAAVCEGCGDCGVKSNCVAVLPLETELGRKRKIDQSACNKDFSCLEGFCPSFVTLEGAQPKKSKPAAAKNEFQHVLVEPKRPALDKPYSMIAAGIGGTGVVTVSAVLAQAAHLAGLGFGSIDMTGLAQKGGSVACHMRVANAPEQISAIRVGIAGADVVLGGDLVVAASAKVLETVRTDETAMVLSTYEMTTGAFTKRPDFKVPGGLLRRSIEQRLGRGLLWTLDAHDASERLFGDAIAANMLLLGAAYQLGLVPIGAPAIEQAIELNGAAVEMNRLAFRYGRLAVADPMAFERAIGPAPDKAATAPRSLAGAIAYRVDQLTAYQDAALAERYRERVSRIAKIETEKAPGRSGLAEAVARGYFKLLAIKDEYEVARLYTDGTFEREISQHFEGTRKIRFHMAPPLLGWLFRDKATGRPHKITLGPWMMPVLRLLARAKRLRGTRWDLFGMTAERRMERQMISDYEALLAEIEQRLTAGNHDMAVALASLPEEIRGFGHVKQATYVKTRQRELVLLAALRSGSAARTPDVAAAE